MKTQQMTEQLELFGCIQCGKCTGGCPVARKTALNIRSLIYHMLVEPELAVNAHEELWDCTCCFTCVERCPKDVRPAELIIGLRGELVESGRIPETIGAALMNAAIVSMRSEGSEAVLTRTLCVSINPNVANLCRRKTHQGTSDVASHSLGKVEAYLTVREILPEPSPANGWILAGSGLHR